MEDFEKDNQNSDEKKAFYVGLATILGIILIIGLIIFFKGCSGSKQELKSAKDNQNKTQVPTPPPAQPINATPAGVAGAQTSTTPVPSGKSYTVQSGDTLYGLGLKFKVDWQSIAEANNIDNAAALKPGKQIIIP